MENGKVCKVCNELKTFDCFSKNKKMKDGYLNKCKVCTKQYRQDNAEHIKEIGKKYREENKEIKNEYYQKNKESIKKKRKKRYETNKESENEYSKRYSQKNAESLKEKNKQYRNSDKGREVSYKRSLKRRSYKHKVQFTPHERSEILERDNWTCQYCNITVHDRHTGDWNTPDKAHIDHIVPLSKGGSSELNNLQVLCRTCNLSKNDKLEF